MISDGSFRELFESFCWIRELLLAVEKLRCIRERLLAVVLSAAVKKPRVIVIRQVQRFEDTNAMWATTRLPFELRSSRSVQINQRDEINLVVISRSSRGGRETVVLNISTD